jgi:hypothetical protein
MHPKYDELSIILGRRGFELLANDPHFPDFDCNTHSWNDIVPIKHLATGEVMYYHDKTATDIPRGATISPSSELRSTAYRGILTRAKARKLFTSLELAQQFLDKKYNRMLAKMNYQHQIRDLELVSGRPSMP